MNRPEPAAGLVVVDKSAGMTSHDVVARVRRLAGTRKVGHAGTLDPMATGVLVLGVGRATRLLGHLMLTEKAYDATIRLGQATTTDDAEGEMTARADASALDEAMIATGLERFVGEIEQVPTAVSAIKVDGKRAHQRVRAGEEVELAARPVTVHELTVHQVRPGEHCEVDISLRCSSGTYVRAIARDLGERFGVGGHLTALRRTAVGAFGLDLAHTLDELAEQFGLLGLDQAAGRSFPSLGLSERHALDVRVGRKIDLELDGITALFAPDGRFLALYEPVTGPVMEPAEAPIGGSSPAIARAVAVFVG